MLRRKITVFSSCADNEIWTITYYTSYERLSLSLSGNTERNLTTDSKFFLEHYDGFEETFSRSEWHAFSVLKTTLHQSK